MCLAGNFASSVFGCAREQGLVPRQSGLAFRLGFSLFCFLLVKSRLLALLFGLCALQPRFLPLPFCPPILAEAHYGKRYGNYQRRSNSDHDPVANSVLRRSQPFSLNNAGANESGLMHAKR